MKNSLKNQAYEYIQAKIMNCEYAPLSLIDAAKIARELGISRTPVRDSIARLESEGLVTVTPRRGIIVSEVPAGEMANIAGVRRLLEPYIATVACGKADSAVLKKYRDIFSTVTDRKQQVKAEYEFSLYLTELTENEYIIQTMRRAYSSNYRVQSVGRFPTGNTEILLELIDCIMQNDPEKASSAVIRLIASQGIY